MGKQATPVSRIGGLVEKVEVGCHQGGWSQQHSFTGVSKFLCSEILIGRCRNNYVATSLCFKCQSSARNPQGSPSQATKKQAMEENFHFTICVTCQGGHQGQGRLAIPKLLRRPLLYFHTLVRNRNTAIPVCCVFHQFDHLVIKGQTALALQSYNLTCALLGTWQVFGNQVLHIISVDLHVTKGTKLGEIDGGPIISVNALFLTYYLNPYYRSNWSESHFIETMTEVLTHGWC